MKETKEVPVLDRNENVDFGTSDILHLNNFQILERHTDVTTYDLSGKWDIRWAKLLKNSRRLNRSSCVMLLLHWIVDTVHI